MPRGDAGRGTKTMTEENTFTIPELGQIEDAISGIANQEMAESIRAKCAAILDAEVMRMAVEMDRKKTTVIYWNSVGQNDAVDLFTNPAHERLEKYARYTSLDISAAYDEHIGKTLSNATESEGDEYWSGFWRKIDDLATMVEIDWDS